MCDQLHRWLTPGGKLLFNIVDFSGLPLWYRARRKARKTLYSVLSQRWRMVLDEREKRSPFFGLTRRELEQILRAISFSQFTVNSRPCESPLWSGSHLECLTAKAAPGLTET